MVRIKTLRIGFIIGYHPLKVMQRISFAIIAFIFFSGLPVHAAANTSPTSSIPQQARSVVADQMSAFKTRNATQAYASISHSFKEKYKSPLRFATMMRLHHWELYNHTAYRFIGQSQSAEGIAIQKVEITSETGEEYIYLFRLSQTEAGGWLIDNVIMLDPEAQPI